MESRIILIFALILFSTKFFGILTKRVHLPQVVGALIAGILLGPAVFDLVEPNETISVLAELGLIIMLFHAGLETDLRQLRDSFKSSLLITFLGFGAAISVGFAIAFLFGKSPFECFLIGVVIAPMSTSITVEALQEMGKFKTKSGTAIMGVAIIEDILVIIMLAVIMNTGVRGFSVISILITLLKITAFFVFSILGGLGVHKLFDFMDEKFGHTRRLSIFALAYCFLLSYIAEQLGLADITGAYIAGLALCTTHCVQYLETKTSVLSYMFFTPIFIANIGFQTSFSGLNGSIVLFTVLIIAAAIFPKILACGLGAKICGFSNRESIQIGIGLITRGEIAIVAAGKTINAGFLDASFFSCVILIVLVTVLITPVLLKLVYKDKKGVDPLSGKLA